MSLVLLDVASNNKIYFESSDKVSCKKGRAATFVMPVKFDAEKPSDTNNSKWLHKLFKINGCSDKKKEKISVISRRR